MFSLHELVFRTAQKTNGRKKKNVQRQKSGFPNVAKILILLWSFIQKRIIKYFQPLSYVRNKETYLIALKNVCKLLLKTFMKTFLADNIYMITI